MGNLVQSSNLEIIYSSTVPQKAFVRATAPVTLLLHQRGVHPTRGSILDPPHEGVVASATPDMSGLWNFQEERPGAVSKRWHPKKQAAETSPPPPPSFTTHLST
eukprot:761266-Hanusia_phi.AAC.2